MGVARCAGSPPPMRGKASPGRRLHCAARITPAHAGKSVPYDIYRQQGQDHPRPCGEKIETNMKDWAKQGSPPPMRGKAGTAIPPRVGAGITPAHAGKSLRRGGRRHPVRDHPRPCGEKHFAKASVTANGGSPPPMRGKATIVVGEPLNVRITPAHAGKRKYGVGHRNGKGDHPRPCGEKPSPRARPQARIGSPPPMRGKEGTIA